MPRIKPCFELWLLLHLVDLEDYTIEEKMRLLINKRDEIVKSRTRLEKELSDLLHNQGGYQKNTIRTEVFLPLVKTAIHHAQKHQWDSDNWVTNAFYTRTSVLVSRILKM